MAQNKTPICIPKIKVPPAYLYQEALENQDNQITNMAMNFEIFLEICHFEDSKIYDHPVEIATGVSFEKDFCDKYKNASVEIPKETLKKTLKKRYHEHRDLRRLSSEIRDMIGDYLWLKNLEGESNLETERESENVISFTKIPK